MKLRYQKDRLVFEFEAETPKDLFRMLAEVQSIFESDRVCGRCNSSHLQCRVRTVDKDEFFELLCVDCESTLAMGQTREGSLFPKRKDRDGNWLDKGGWKPAYTGKRAGAGADER